MGLIAQQEPAEGPRTYSLFLVDINVQQNIVQDKIFLLHHQLKWCHRTPAIFHTCAESRKCAKEYYALMPCMIRPLRTTPPRYVGVYMHPLHDTVSLNPLPNDTIAKSSAWMESWSAEKKISCGLGDISNDWICGIRRVAVDCDMLCAKSMWGVNCVSWIQYLPGLEEVDIVLQSTKTRFNSAYNMLQPLPQSREIVPGSWRAKAGQAILDFAKLDLEKHIQSSGGKGKRPQMRVKGFNFTCKYQDIFKGIDENEDSCHYYRSFYEHTLILVGIRTSDA